MLGLLTRFRELVRSGLEVGTLGLEVGTLAFRLEVGLGLEVGTLAFDDAALWFEGEEESAHTRE